MVSKEMKKVITLLERFQSEEPSVEETRKTLKQMTKLSKIPDDINFEPVDIDGIKGEWITAPNSRSEKVLYYLHGGGFVAGSIDTHRDLVSRICRIAKVRGLMIDYRLAPEHPFPAALEDAFKAYKWLINEKKVETSNLVIGGDSAGGGLTFSVLIKARDGDLPLPAAAVVISPATDLAGEGVSFFKKADVDPFLTPELGELFRDCYLEETNPKNPLASPLYADLHGLPPIYIQVGTSEILLDDSKRIAKKLESENVDVELDVWEDMIHVFAAFGDLAPEGKEGTKKIAEFIKEHI